MTICEMHITRKPYRQEFLLNSHKHQVNGQLITSTGNMSFGKHFKDIVRYIVVPFWKHYTTVATFL